MSLTIGAGLAIGAGVSALASGITHWINKRNQDKTLDKTNRMNKENWSLENAYNSPSAQMSRLRAAGLNPNLVYQSGAANASGSIDQPQQGQPIADYTGAANDISAFINSQSQATQVEQSVRTAEAQKDYYDSLSAGIRSENIMKEAKSKFANDFVLRELNNLSYQGDFMQQQTDNLRATKKLTLAQADLTEQEAKSYSSRFYMDMYSARQQNLLTQKQIDEIDARIANIGQNIKESKSRVTFMTAQANSILVDTARAKIAKLIEESSANYLLKSPDDKVNRENILQHRIYKELDYLEQQIEMGYLGVASGALRDVGLGIGGAMQLFNKKKSFKR